LDLRRVDEVADVSLRLLGEVRQNLAKVDRDLVLIDSEGTLAETFRDVNRAVPTFDTRTAAVEWCENELITRYGSDLVLPSEVEVAQCPALSPLTDEDVAALAQRMEDRTYDKGHVVRRVGQPFGGVYFILSGKIVTSAPGPSGERLKLTTLSAGMTFGELALGSDDRQETTVKALEDVHVKVLTAQAIRTIEKDDPRLAVELWKALTRDAYSRVDLYLRETAVRIRD
ncbi:MAG: glutaminase, partial [Micrococcaceae bacterium]|nr:glutaminase [Micrococcaceae bacterium]